MTATRPDAARHDSSVPAGAPPSAAAPSHDHGERIPSLDGLRAFSITAVLLGHLAGTHGFPAPLAHLIEHDVVDVANFGVRVFFVISGFLITGLLLSEEANYGRISLGRFYLRRTFRIMPAYIVFLVAVLILRQVGWLALRPGDVAHAVTYTMNYHLDRAWYVGHLWSLSVEEQFYLLWPATLLLLGVRRGLRAALVFVLLAPLFRIGTWYLVPDWRYLIGNTFETTGDSIAVGCLLAGWRAGLWKRAWYRRVIASRWIIPALGVLAVVLSSRFRPAVLLGITAMNVVIALGIDRCVRRSDGVVGRVLNVRPVAYVGLLSYSLYLWQQLFVNRSATVAVASFPLNMVLAITLAVLSYYLVERPMLRLRVRVEHERLPRRKPGSATPTLVA